jgi:large subunit ribosomal protein L6
VSRIGKKPIPIPAGVTIKKDGTLISVKGPKGELSTAVNDVVTVDVQSEEVVVTRPNDLALSRSLHGLTRSLINNMVVGVTEGYERRLDIVGVGYRAELRGKALLLNIGYSHPVMIFPPDGVSIDVPANTEIVITGIDKQLVGQVTAKIRAVRPPEPYKGKGIKYRGEQIRRKAGKSAAK